MFPKIEYKKVLFWSWNKAYVLDDSDIVNCVPRIMVKNETTRNSYVDPSFREDCASVGYCANCSRSIERILISYLGHPYSDVMEEIKKRGDACRKRKERSNVDWNEWLSVKESFDGRVNGLSRYFDVVDNDFTVRLTMVIGDFEGNRKYFREHSKEIIAYVKDEIRKNGRMMKKIGDLNFYYCSEAIVLRNGEVEFKFSVKKVLEEKNA